MGTISHHREPRILDLSEFIARDTICSFSVALSYRPMEVATGVHAPGT